MNAPSNDFVLVVEGLSVAFGTGDKEVTAVEGVSFSIGRGEMVGLVGESGSGKSVTSLAVTGLIGYNGGRVTSGSVRLNGVDLLAMDQKPRSSILRSEEHTSELQSLMRI